MNECIEVHFKGEDRVIDFEGEGKKYSIPFKDLKQFEVKTGRWRAEKNGWYYTLTSNGTIVEMVEYFYDTDDYRYNVGNYFKTKEQAKNYKQKLLVLGEMQNWADEHNDEIDWESGKLKTSISYDCKIKKFELVFWANYKSETIYFSSSDLANQALEIFGERLKKYVYEV